MSARSCRPTYRQFLKVILAGPVLHIDETKVRPRTGKGYVWALATSEAAVHLYRPTDKGDLLRRLLKDFRGVAVSDFDAASDGLPCPGRRA